MLSVRHKVCIKSILLWQHSMFSDLKNKCGVWTNLCGVWTNLYQHCAKERSSTCILYCN